MARLTQLSNENASPEAQQLFSAIQGQVGMVPNVYRVVANQPAALSGLLGLGAELGKGNFDAHTREAIALTVAGANECDYCASAHSAISKGLKVSEQEIQSRLNGHSEDSRIQAILSFANAVVHKRGFVSESDLQSARDSQLSDADIVETIGNVIANIFTNYVNHVAQPEIDFPVVTAKAA